MFDDNKPNREELIQMASRAAESGQKDGAKVMFRQILSQDKRNERALLWMAKLSETRAERVQWLKRLLAVNPNHEPAKKELAKIERSEAAQQNRLLITFGVAAAVMLVLLVLAIIVISLLS